ncbi:hypothetical protein KIL84_017533 [Mauremys mutica]|uniref:Uncharacterized protein n=1 Tax=Mauremys mutica TaxID=74926 RepID=A0A9D3X1A2_9SAUR|nr:hypothetical protein KIL84_017533 [Mauremys mutica]
MIVQSDGTELLHSSYSYMIKERKSAILKSVRNFSITLAQLSLENSETITKVNLSGELQQMERAGNFDGGVQEMEHNVIQDKRVSILITAPLCDRAKHFIVVETEFESRKYKLQVDLEQWSYMWSSDMHGSLPSVLASQLLQLIYMLDVSSYVILHISSHLNSSKVLYIIF